VRRRLCGGFRLDIWGVFSCSQDLETELSLETIVWLVISKRGLTVLLPFALYV